jgi:hypothetical protein
MISLGIFERLASNERVAQSIREAGFIEVSVAGSGRLRQATALWPNEDASAEIPPQIAKIEEIEV